MESDSSSESEDEEEEEIKAPRGRVKPAYARKAVVPPKKPVGRAAPAKNIVNNKKPAAIAQRRIVNWNRKIHEGSDYNLYISRV